MAETIIERLKRLRTEAIEELRLELIYDERKSVDENHLQEILRVIETDKLVLVSGQTEVYLHSAVSQRNVEIMAILVGKTLEQHFTVKIADPAKKEGLSEASYNRRGFYCKVLVISGW